MEVLAGRGLIVGPAINQYYPERHTSFLIFSCIWAASGGLIFGYDIGITGGVTEMDDFLRMFFPGVYTRKLSALEDDYCKYDDHFLQLFTSSLYLAALLSSLVASFNSRRRGRISSIRIGGICCFFGAILMGGAPNLWTLFVGRVVLGIGVGFANQAIPLYLTEMAPTRSRGAFNFMFQLAITTGILVANLVNYGTAKITLWGWRISFGMVGIVALSLAMGSFILTDTPNSLIERGKLDEGRALLRKIRGTPDVNIEFNEMVEASMKASVIQRPLKTIFERQSRPQLVMVIFIPLFQQLTGINVIMFYAPLLFQTLGFRSASCLFSALIIGIVNVGTTLLAIAIVDKIGRRKLFLQGGGQMFLSQVIIGTVLAFNFRDTSLLDKHHSIIVVSLICVYIVGFAWSWGPLGWLVPSEIFPLETRSIGQSINISTNMLFTFVIAQAFLPMLCRFKYNIFFFFSGWLLIMSTFILLMLPETKDISIDDMTQVWSKHWFWKRFTMDDEDRFPVVLC